MSVQAPQPSFKAPDIAELAPLFPGYEFEILIAVGGMGAVYRAIQKSLDRTVAIKILPKEFSEDASFCAGFEAEAKAMARLNHPNLIGVYDFGEVMGMLYIVMEYVPGKSLYHSAHGIAIDPQEVVRIVTGICSGLAHAHEHGIIHRDIKPSNILLDLNAQPKIGDFGLARPIEKKVQEGEEIFGTPHYTAPEVVKAPHTVDNRADIFSVGVMIHELLTGRLPADDRRSASAIVHCNPRFDAIIRKASHPVAAARYPSAAKLAEDLQQVNIAAVGNGPKTLQIHNFGGRPKAALLGSRIRKPMASANHSSSSSFVFVILGIAALIAAIAFFANRSAQPAININTPDNNPGPLSIPPLNKPETNPNIPQVPGTNTNPAPTPATPPTSQPIPEPKPHTPAKPAPETNLQTAQDPKPEPNPEPKSQFNTDEFLERARTLMKERAAPLVTEHDKDIRWNLSDYERKIEGLIRKIDDKTVRDKAEIQMKQFMTMCRNDGSRIPPQTGMIFNPERGFYMLHDEFLAKQADFDSKLGQQITELSRSYILGIEMQIDRLNQQNDADAIQTLKEEAEKTRTNQDHFRQFVVEVPEL